MTLAALPNDIEVIWWISLGVGIVVAIVVVVLLHTLLNAVRKVERNVEVLWETATMVARNTATTWMLGQTADGLDQIKNEALKHDALLNKMTGDGRGEATQGDLR